MRNLKSKIREIPDFPKKGINFKDITTLLQDKQAFNYCVNNLSNFFKIKKIDKVVGIDTRGFLLAAPVAYKLKAGLVLARKKGKLPAKVFMCEYDLEYGKDVLEIHQDAFRPGERILIIDDVLATGGTAEAAIKLVKKLQGKIMGLGFLVDLTFLGGVKKLKKYSVYSLIKY